MCQYILLGHISRGLLINSISFIPAALSHILMSPYDISWYCMFLRCRPLPNTLLTAPSGHNSSARLKWQTHFFSHHNIIHTDIIEPVFSRKGPIKIHYSFFHALELSGCYQQVLQQSQLVSFSSLFHESLHSGTTSNAQNLELKRIKPVVMLKLNIIVTLSMLKAIFATLHKKNTIVIKIKKWQNLLIEGLFRVTL